MKPLIYPVLLSTLIVQPGWSISWKLLDSEAEAHSHQIIDHRPISEQSVRKTLNYPFVSADEDIPDQYIEQESFIALLDDCKEQITSTFFTKFYTICENLYGEATEPCMRAGVFILLESVFRKVKSHFALVARRKRHLEEQEKEREMDPGTNSFDVLDRFDAFRKGSPIIGGEDAQ